MPWFAIEEYVEQVRDRLCTLCRHADHLWRVLSTLPPWMRGTPAHVMMKRALTDTLTEADRLYLQAEGTRDLVLTESADDDMQQFEMLAREERTIASLEARLSAYREVIHQRAALTDPWDWLVSSEGTNEIIELQGFYTAIDALILGFLEAIFGQSWIVQQEQKSRAWLPLVVLGHDYSIRPDTGVAYVPRADLFRARMWPALAHEIAHLKVARLIGRDGLFFPSQRISSPYPLSDELLQDIPDEALEELGISAELSHRKDIRDGLEELGSLIHNIHKQILGGFVSSVGSSAWWPHHLSEFLCDAICVHVSGPAGLLAYTALHRPLPSNQEEPIHLELAARYHPPRLVRVLVMHEILSSDTRGFSGLLRECGVHEYIEAVQWEASDTWESAAERWVEHVPTLAMQAAKVATLLLPSSSIAVNSDRIQSLRRALLDEEGSDLELCGAADIVNIAWLKRIIVKSSTAAYAGPDTPSELARRAAFDPVPRIFGGVVRSLNGYGRQKWRAITSDSGGQC